MALRHCSLSARQDINPLGGHRLLEHAHDSLTSQPPASLPGVASLVLVAFGGDFTEFLISYTPTGFAGLQAPTWSLHGAILSTGLVVQSSGRQHAPPALFDTRVLQTPETTYSINYSAVQPRENMYSTVEELEHSILVGWTTAILSTRRSTFI